MGLWDQPSRDVRPLIRDERAALLSLLAELDAEMWQATTACPGWTVKDVALHITQGDVGVLARDRDSDPSSLLTGFDDDRAFAAALNAQNQRWVDATRVLSSDLIRDLLAFTGSQLHDYWASVPLDAHSRVSWAGPDPVPRWFGLAQELTERWVHQQQIRDAVDAPGLADERFLDAVLSTFVWVLPHHYRTLTGPDTTISIRFEGVGGSAWTLTRHHDRWDLYPRPAVQPEATITMPSHDAWRLFTGALTEHDHVQLDGDTTLTEHVLSARAIIT